MEEPPDEYVRLHDFHTGNFIICTNGKNLKDFQWLQQFQNVNVEKTRNGLKYAINVADDCVPYLDDTKTFSHCCPLFSHWWLIPIVFVSKVFPLEAHFFPLHPNIQNNNQTTI